MPEQMLAPFWADFRLDENSAVYADATEERLVISWENLSEYGFGSGSNLTFQAVLTPDGQIRYQYELLDGTRWPMTVIGLRNTAAAVTPASVVTPADWSTVTGSVGQVITQYVDRITERAVSFGLTEDPMISVLPTDGTVAPGERFEVTLLADASRLSTGSGSVTNQVDLSIVHNGASSPDALSMVFTVTNTATASASELIDRDGDGMSDDAERIAGTDLLDANSFFTPQMFRTEFETILSWPSAGEDGARIYKIYWTPDLMRSWTLLATVTNSSAYADTEHQDEPVTYYKVTVE
jgi:hypothetical protein